MKFVVVFKISMSVWPPIHVTKMLTASTPMALSSVLADRDLLEMEQLAKVLIATPYPLKSLLTE